MSFDGFQMYLCSPEGSIFKPQLRELHQNMGQPLSHYFISSSHNTYLLEDQLRGHSSLEAYIQWEHLQPAHTLFLCSVRGKFRQQLSVINKESDLFVTRGLDKWVVLLFGLVHSFCRVPHYLSFCFILDKKEIKHVGPECSFLKAWVLYSGLFTLVKRRTL